MNDDTQCHVQFFTTFDHIEKATTAANVTYKYKI